MADAITKNIISGKHEMAWTGETPWHGLGQNLQEGASIEDWASAAGMEWEVKRSNIFYDAERKDGALIEVTDRNVLYRSDSKNFLGTVSDQYKIVQPREVLEFFRDLTEQSGFKMETAGTLFDGKRFWALARAGKEAFVADKRDIVKPYLLLSTSCDGSLATEGRLTSIRVVCNNTLQMARGESGAKKSRIRHKTTFDMGVMKNALGIDVATNAFDETMEQFRKLAAVKLDKDIMETMTLGLFKKDAEEMDAGEREKALGLRGPSLIMQLAQGEAQGSNFRGAHDTAWAWLNSVTQFIDHGRESKALDRKLDRAWWGSGARIKDAAFDMALALL